jgi:hypothetical protein
MGSLKNPKHEAFAAAVARGERASKAYVIAGYSSSRQNAHRLSSCDYIKQRVVELQTQPQNTAEVDGRDPETGRFITGNNGGGRPRGSRSRLGEAFVSDLYAEWQHSGAGALKTVAQEDPVQFVKVVASVLPRELELRVNTDLFAEARDFLQAWTMARQHIGADPKPALIEYGADDAAG